MRTNITLLILLIFFLGYRAIESQKVTKVYPEQFLPTDTVAFFYHKDGVRILDKFLSSSLGQALSEIDLVEVAEYVEIPEEQVGQIESVLDTIRTVTDNRLFRRVLGNDFTLALFPERAWSKPVFPLPQYLLHQTLVISRQQSLRSFLYELKKEFPQAAAAEKVRFGSYTIYRIGIGDKILVVTAVSGYLLVSFEERLLRESLTIMDEPYRNLFASEDYTRFVKQTEGSVRRFYLDLETLRQICDSLKGHVNSAGYAALLTELTNLKGFQYAGYAGWLDPSGRKDRLLVKLEVPELPPITGKMLSQKPETNETLEFVVDDALLYYWSNTLDLTLLWEMYVTETEPRGESIQQISSAIQTITGKSVVELTDIFDNDIGCILRPSEHDQFIPIPDIALLVKLKDRKQAKDLMDTVTDHFSINLQSRRYKNIKYFYWGLYPMESLQPVYAIHKGYLIIANTLDIFTSIVDLHGDKNPLADAIEFAHVDPGFKEKNNSAFYIDQKTFLMHMRELISWGGTMLAIQDRQAAAKSKILIDRLINPLLLGLTMYEKSATRTHLTDGWIITESTTKINSKKNAKTR